MLLILAHMKRCSSPPMRYKGSYVPECIPTLSFRRLSGMWGILKCWEAFMSARALSATTAAWVRWRRFGRPATSIYVSPIVSTCGQESGGLSCVLAHLYALQSLHFTLTKWEIVLWCLLACLYALQALHFTIAHRDRAYMHAHIQRGALHSTLLTLYTFILSMIESKAI